MKLKENTEQLILRYRRSFKAYTDAKADNKRFTIKLILHIKTLQKHNRGKICSMYDSFLYV